jgi:hypothetical protein
MSAEPSSMTAIPGRRWEDLIDAAASATEEGSRDVTPVRTPCTSLLMSYQSANTLPFPNLSELLFVRAKAVGRLVQGVLAISLQQPVTSKSLGTSFKICQMLSKVLQENYEPPTTIQEDLNAGLMQEDHQLPHDLSTLSAFSSNEIFVKCDGLFQLLIVGELADYEVSETLLNA